MNLREWLKRFRENKTIVEENNRLITEIKRLNVEIRELKESEEFWEKRSDISWPVLVEARRMAVESFADDLLSQTCLQGVRHYVALSPYFEDDLSKSSKAENIFSALSREYQKLHTRCVSLEETILMLREDSK